VWNDELSKIEKLDVAYKRKRCGSGRAAAHATIIETEKRESGNDQ
jgi:hypothetical protein